MRHLIYILFIFLASCASKNIIHREGKHHATHMGKMQTFYASYFASSVEVKFSKLAWYSPDLIEGNPWNKITGRGGLAYKRSESVRKTEQMIVWRPIADSLFEVAYYGRKDYEMYWDIFDTVAVNEPLNVPIRKHLKSIVPTGAYFGGRKPAPHLLNYRVKRKGFRFIF